MRCQYCGREIPDQSKFCKYCGKNMLASFPTGQTINNTMSGTDTFNAENVLDGHSSISTRPGFMLAITGMICAGIGMILPVVGTLFLGAIFFTVFSCLTSYANIKMRNINLMSILGILVSALSVYMLYIYFKTAFTNPSQLSDNLSYAYNEIVGGGVNNKTIGYIQYVLYLLFKCM